MNTKALELKAGLLRRTGCRADAAQVAGEILRIDPLDARALYEQSMACEARSEESRKPLAQMASLMRGEVHSYLELAMDYANTGMFEEATQVLQDFVEQAEDKSRIDPQVFYFLGFFHDKTGQPQRGLEDIKKAATMPADFCFPFQFEAESILRHAIERNPADARARYYLGNLLFDNQPSKALAFWEEAVRLDGQFGPAQRNLGLAKARVERDIPGAVACLEKAVALAPADPRLYYELEPSL